MTFIRINKSFISILLVFAILFSISGTKVNAAITREQMQKVIKWGTIGGVALSAVIGAATFGIGGFIVGAGLGALVTTVVCDHFGVAPADQWKQVFPNFKLPFKYNRQNQSGLGISIPVNSPAASMAPAADKTFADSVREKYQKAYRNYTEALKTSKDSGLIKKALDAYKKAKAEFDKLR
ncbi:MAG: hypothetical protein Kow0029_11440 [Candidatus Rifleibacteriota bacterium]